MGQRVIILRGLPASGKSTYARKRVEKHQGRYKIVSKDLLRGMLDAGKYSKENELFILKARDTLILLALREGYHVIVDDTNLREIHIQTICDLVKDMATIEIKDFTDVPLETCIERDRNRPNYVGEKVIRDMYRQFLQPKPEPPAYDPSLPDAVLCDLDGTLALLNGRNPYDASTCEEDAINEPVRSTVAMYRASGNAIILVSGRAEQHRLPTERWLEKHDISYDVLYMRPDGDSRKDALIKREIYEQYIKGHWNVKLILDDRRQVIDFWRSLGLTVFQVAESPD